MAENPSAFPVVLPMGYEEAENGMTLRDWFAGMALAGFMASEHADGSYRGRIAAEGAYMIADAMLKARAREGEA